MSILHGMRQAARKIGLEVHRYNPAQSLDARSFAMLSRHGIRTVIDVGANDGGYAGYLRRGGFDGRIVSFEPLPDVHNVLASRARHDPAWIVAPQCALGSTTGQVEIHVAGNSKSSSLLPMLKTHVDAAPYSATVGKVSVPLMRLDDVELDALRSGDSMFLKIDTQGYELPVLEGAGATLSRCTGVQLEMSIEPLYEGQVLYRGLIGWLEARGFHLWNLLPGFSDPSTGRLLQMDGVFFRAGLV